MCQWLLSTVEMRIYRIGDNLLAEGPVLQFRDESDRRKTIIWLLRNSYEKDD